MQWETPSYHFILRVCISEPKLTTAIVSVLLYFDINTFFLYWYKLASLYRLNNLVSCSVPLPGLFSMVTYSILCLEIKWIAPGYLLFFKSRPNLLFFHSVYQSWYVFHFFGWMTHSWFFFGMIGLQFPLHPWISICPGVNINLGVLKENHLALMSLFMITLLTPISPCNYLIYPGWFQIKQDFQSRLSGGRSVEVIKQASYKNV